MRLLCFKLMSRLVVNPDAPEEWAIELQPGTISLGRSADNNFPIEHPSVSTEHCQVTVSDSGTWLRDLGSTGGTFVDGELVEETKLKTGQIIRMGEIIMRFESDAPHDSSASVGSLALQPPIAQPVPGVASVFCKFHPKTLARFACAKCAQNFCDFCVNTRSVGNKPQKFCRACGSECRPLQPQVVATQPPPGFLTLLPRAFIYPFQGSGVMLLVAGTVCFYLLGHFPLLGVILTGYLFNYAKSIITSTAGGRQDPPDWPDFGDWKDDILMPYLQFFGLLALAFGPALIIGIWRPGTETQVRIAVLAALGFGALFAPMAMLALAMFDSFEVLNPIPLAWSILRVPIPYLITAAAFETVLALYWFTDAPIRSLIPVPFLPGLVSSFLYLYLVAVGMRMLGLLYLTHRDEFGWFSRLR